MQYIIIYRDILSANEAGHFLSYRPDFNIYNVRRRGHLVYRDLKAAL